MTTAEIESLRPGFEAWYLSDTGHSPGLWIREGHVYENYIINRMFQAWCAAKSEPVEITEGMKARAEKALRWKCAEIEHRPSVADADAMWFADEYVDAILTAALSPAQDGEL